MSAYVMELNRQLAKDTARQDREDEAKRAAEARDRLTPLEDRLARLLATIPMDVQLEGLSLPALQTALRGRWRGSCHPGELGAALRKLGYVRKRSWSSEEGFAALWYPGKED